MAQCVRLYAQSLPGTRTCSVRRLRVFIKASRVMDSYISTLKDVDYLSFEDELCEIQADSVSTKYFQENRYKTFWIVKGHTVTPRLGKHAVKSVILPLSTTYLSESAFSFLLTITTKASMSTRTLDWSHNHHTWHRIPGQRYASPRWPSAYEWTDWHKGTTCLLLLL